MLALSYDLQSSYPPTTPPFLFILFILQTLALMLNKFRSHYEHFVHLGSPYLTITR